MNQRNSLLSLVPQNPSNALLLIAFVFGLLYLLITPPYQVADEDAHFFRAYRISEGQPYPETLDGRPGAMLPKSLSKMAVVTRGLAFKPDLRISARKVIEEIHTPLNDNERMRIEFNAPLSSPYVYAPQVTGIWIGRQLNLPPIFILYLARLGNLLVWAVCVYAAITTFPAFGWGLFLLALTPMSLTLAASASPDALTNATAFLLIALILRFATDPETRLGPTQILALLILATLMGLVKIGYLALVVLVVAIPRRKFASTGAYLSVVLGAPILAIVACLTWVVLVHRVYDPTQMLMFGPYDPVAAAANGGHAALPPPTSEVYSPSLQAKYILQHPLSYLLLNLRVLSLPYLTSVIGKLGWYDTKLSIFVVAPYFVALVWVCLVCRRKQTTFTLGQKLIVAFTAFATLLAIHTPIYLVLNKVGNPKIFTLQGRYLIPLTPLVFLLLYNHRIPGPKNPRILPAIAFGTSLVTGIYVAFALVQRYYTW